MSRIWSNDEGQIEKEMFTFTIGDLMKVPVLVLVSFIPLEAFARGDGSFHGTRILQQYTRSVKMREVMKHLSVARCRQVVEMYPFRWCLVHSCQ